MEEKQRGDRESRWKKRRGEKGEGGEERKGKERRRREEKFCLGKKLKNKLKMKKLGREYLYSYHR